MVKHFDNPQEKESYLGTIRQKSLQEADVIANKSRFALFSSPPPLAIGDNSYDHVVNVEKNEQGKPKTEPRQIQTNPAKKGKIKSSFFSDLGYISIGDKYIDEYKQNKKEEMEKKSKIPKEQPQFKYSSGYKLVIKPSYEYQSDTKEIKKKQTRDENGKVIVQDRNPQTGPNIKNLYKYPSYMVDQYDRQQQQLSQERLNHLAKVKELPEFKPMSVEREYFSSLREIFFEDPAIKKRQKKELDLKSLHHEQNFKPSNPSKKGYNGYLSKIPEYISDPIKDLVRKELTAGEKKEIFKLNQPQIYIRPTPSIALNQINMRSMVCQSLR